jgi:hypothetical protein
MTRTEIMEKLTNLNAGAAVVDYVEDILDDMDNTLHSATFKLDDFIETGSVGHLLDARNIVWNAECGLNE